MNDLGKVMGISDKAGYFLDSLKSVSGYSFILDILIVSILFYWAYLFLRQTRAMRILYGLILIAVLVTLGRLLNLMLLNWILHYIMAMLVVAIPIVFQPELRAALEKLGRARFIKDILSTKEKNERLINNISNAVLNFSKSKIGCLIVIQRRTGLREYIEAGMTINAEVSSALLTSIFLPKSPLHDGATIIAGDQILSAKSILPVSDASINLGLGTRHRAGLGITENSDAISVIVSEETGSISLAVGGKLERRISDEKLRSRLASLLKGTSNDHH
jgi:diadenylate cyclase